ncbi:hypothetical protein AURDEDRAFT_116513 [Auricularia subglabra TFB-10046 SS5]|nr:hypothetical protein AURDEDRAFT_116513 [Auricularia subglabra TFB-10046 SS5]
MSTRYEVLYFGGPGIVDLSRMMLDVAGAPYENTLTDYAGHWATIKNSMAFGKVPRLTIYYADGTKKELFESSALDAYLAETLGFLPGTDAFSRTECLSVVSSLSDLEEKVRVTSELPTVEARRAAQVRHLAETIPGFLRFHERFAVARSGQYYFGDKLTAADLKLYTVFLKFDEMYAADGTNPFKTHAQEVPKLAKIIESLEAGRAGDYARNRRKVGPYRWFPDRLQWGFQ